jgi:RNA polymerase sigma-70 factor (ECF subfamily)
VNAAREGDAQGFEALYRRIAPAVYAWSSLRIGPGLRNFLDPEDVVQEVWWRALQTFPNYDATRASFRTWIFGIANHVLLKGYRKAGQRGAGAEAGPKNSPPEGESLDAIPAEATSVSQAVARDETLAACIARLLDLPDDDRHLALLCGIEGLSAPEAAPFLGIGAEAAAKRWQRLRARLREAVPFKDLLAD